MFFADRNLRNAIHAGLVVLVAVALAVPAWAQTGTSVVLQGTVQDATGAVVTGAKITVKNPITGVARTANTDSNGRYIFAGLPPTGSYTLSVEAPGFATQTATGLAFQANAQPVINFTLKPGQARQEVQISEAAPLVETTRSETANVIAERNVENLPLNGRNFFSYVSLTPGAVNVGGGSGNVTLNGQGRRELTILADGMTNQLREIRTLAGDAAGANGTFNLDAVREVQVVTNNFSAEFGRSPAGVVNVITKSGTNDLHGTAYGYFRPGAWDAKNTLTGKVNNLNRQQWGGSLGGPVIKDKTHFFAAYEQVHQTQNASGITSILQQNPGVLLTVPFKSFNILGKVDHQLTTSNRIEVRYNLLRSHSDNNGIGGLNTTDRASTTINNDHSLVGSVTSVLSPRTVNEARVAFTKDRLDFCQPQFTGCPGINADFGAIPVAVNRSGIGNTGPDPSLPQNLRETGLQYNDKMSHTLGRHNLKWGGDVQQYFRFVTFFNNFPGTYTFGPGTPLSFNPADPKTFPRQYAQNFGSSGVNFHEALLGIYLQDDFIVNRNLTLNLGVRYDYETLMHDSNNLAPRVGFALDPTGSGKTVIRGGFGLFYATIESSLINRESNFGPGGQTSILLTPSSPFFPIFPSRLSGVPPAGVVKDTVYIPLTRGLSSRDFPFSVGDRFGGLRVNPYTEQVLFGVQRELAHNLVLSVDYNHVHGLKLLRTQDFNAPPYFAVGPGRTRSLAQADAQRPFGVPSVVPGPLGITFGGYRRLLAQISGDQNFYDAMKVVLQKRFSRHFNLQANYVWSHAISDSDNFRESDSLHLDPANPKIDRGNADQDRRHNFALFGTWDMPFGFRVGGIFSAISGFPYSGVVGFDADGNGDATRDRPAAVPRNSFNARRQVNLDANIMREFHITEHQRIEARFEAFNTLNHVNIANVNRVLGLDPLHPAKGFATPTAVAPNRQFQFSFRYMF